MRNSVRSLSRIWAVLAAIIIIAAAWYYLVFQPPLPYGGTVARTGCLDDFGIASTDWSFSGDTLTFMLENRKESNVIVTGAAATVLGAKKTSGMETELEPGGKTEVRLAGFAGVQPGERMRADVEISFMIEGIAGAMKYTCSLEGVAG